MIQRSYVRQSSCDPSALSNLSTCLSLHVNLSRLGNKSTFLIQYVPFCFKEPLKHQQLFAHISSLRHRAASWWGDLDSLGHFHKQAVSGLRRASLPEQEADSWQGVTTSQLSPIARPKGGDGDFKSYQSSEPNNEKPYLNNFF